MFLRSILYPSLLVSAIGMPMIISDSWNAPPSGRQQSSAPANYSAPEWQSPRVAATQPPYTAPASFESAPIQTQNAPVGSYHVPTPAGNIRSALSSSIGGSAGLSQVGSINPGGNNPSINLETQTQPINFAQPTQTPGSIPVGQPFLPASFTNTNGPSGINNQPLLPGMTPDFGAAETFVFPGNADGPDLTATPLDYVPVTNLAEILRFDVFPNWVKSRWKRVSTSPGDPGLHGLRVACVTGTNSWDLHGSLTYYFDANQRAQRITFQGWTGDSSRLVNLLTSQYGLQAQPTHWAGCYVSMENNKRRGQPVSGLLMQHPAVIATDNPVQQVALMMELNHPEGSFRMSETFRGMVRYALQTQ